MRRFVTILAIFSIGLAASSPLRAATPDWQALDALIEPYQQANEPGISVAVSIDGVPVYQRWAGQANLAHDIPIDADTRFMIASVSKQFTAFAIMMLANEGKLTLDQDVREIIPELEARPIPVTVRHLLNHTSGLREVNSLLQLTGAYDSSPVTQPRALDLIFRQRGGNFSAGERQEYSNTGYELLGEIVARLSGQSFPAFLRSRVFEPLGMDQTFVRADSDQVIRDLAVSYRPIENGFGLEHQLAATFGSTGIISNPRDILRWAHALETGEIGGEAVIDALEARSTLPDGRRAIATNGQEYRDFRGMDTWSHGGSTGGYRSFLLRIPEARMAIVVMSNRSDFLKASFAFEVAEALLADRIEPEQSAKFVPETGTELDRYIGDYQLFSGVVFSIRRDGDDLTFATFGKEDVASLPQVGKGSFMLNPRTQLRVEFRDFSEGRASEMRWQVSEDGYIRAPRIAMQPVPQTPLKTEELLGTYYCDTLQQAVAIIEEGDSLFIRTSDGNRIPLERYQPDLFRADGPGSVLRVQVVRGTEGFVSGVLISGALADDLEYRKIGGSEIASR